MNGVVSITIENWDKYNPRSDRKNHIWFRMQNSFFTDQKIFSLSGDQQRLYMFLLCEASKHDEGHLSLNIDYTAAILKTNSIQILNDITALSDCGLLTSNANHKPAKRRPAAVISPASGITTDRQTDIQTNRQTLKALSQSDAPRFIQSYISAYQTRYGEKTRPDLGGKVQGAIKRFLKDTPIDRACDLIQVYCQLDDQWFKTKHHDFITFEQNISKVSVALTTGKQDSNSKSTLEQLKEMGITG